jgi:HPr kinase/phosphorylase
MPGCTIQELAAHFSLKPIYTSETSLSRPITVIEVDRPGLEMAGFYEYHQKSRLVIIGKKELAYLSHMSEVSAYEAFRQICANETPGIIVCHGQKTPDILAKAAAKKDCAVFETQTETSAFEADALNYLSEKLAPRTSIHADLLEIFGAGTIIQGQSGIGKSEVALDLLKRGHVLVADDKVDILDVRGRLEGSCPDVLYGMMEVRGIGIVDVPRMFGINSIKKAAHIKYCVDLVAYNPAENYDRLGGQGQTVSFLDHQIPYIKLPVSPGRSMAEVIEVAITNLKLKEFGYNTAEEFEKRLIAARQSAAEEAQKKENK